METIKQTIYRTYEQEIDYKVVDVVHNIPTWVFPEGYASPLKTPCPICHKEMNLNIAHGKYVDFCSVIKLDRRDAMPIHTNCFFGDSNYFKQHPEDFK